jgi:hypothetical protein
MCKVFITAEDEWLVLSRRHSQRRLSIELSSPLLGQGMQSIRPAGPNVSMQELMSTSAGATTIGWPISLGRDAPPTDHLKLSQVGNLYMRPLLG